jgi:hypothetical protein
MCKAGCEREKKAKTGEGRGMRQWGQGPVVWSHFSTPFGAAFFFFLRFNACRT